MINNMNTDQFDEKGGYKRGDEFPKVAPIPPNKSMMLNWRKYFHGNNEWIEIPKNNEYLDQETLVAAFNGKIIDTSEKHVENINYSQIERIDLR